MTKILHISDTHGMHRKMHSLPYADIIIHSGDFCKKGTEDEVIDFIEWFDSLEYKHKIFIAGNHDDFLHEAQILGLPENMHYLCYSSINIEGINIYGIPMFPADIINQKYEKQIQELPRSIDILITHQPPFGILDKTTNTHYGNIDILNKVCTIKPKFHLFGHVHNNNGIILDSTTFINSAMSDDNYQLKQKYHIFNY